MGGKGSLRTLRRAPSSCKGSGAGFPARRRGHDGDVSLWLLTIPGTLGLLAVVLFLSAWTESHFLSPRSLILGAVRSRHSTPEHVETLVARQLERLLSDSPR